MVSTINHFIGGQFQTPVGDTFQSLSPQDHCVIGVGSVATETQISDAISCAKRAGKLWRSMAFSDRLHIIKSYALQLKHHETELATLITREMGKPIWESRLEVSAMINKVAISETAYHDRCPTVKGDGDMRYTVLEHRPHGVMVVLSPFNFPGHLPNGHIVPALLAGNTVVLKPSEFTPLVAQLMVKCWADAGLPPGVLNMVQGDGAVGKQLIAHPDINGVLFTGSAITGQRLSTTLASRPNVILAMELGGNNPLIVSSFSDPKSVVWTVISSAFLTTGQRCTSARRLIVLDTPQNRQLVDMVVSRTKQMVIGPGNHADTFMGPLIHDASCAAVLSYQDRLRMQGGKEMLAATRLDMPGSFVSPGIIDVTDAADIPDEEIFGPLLSVYFVSAIADAIAVANNTAYGLSASIITSDIDEFDHVNESLRVGLLNWNLPTNGAASTLPFGAWGAVAILDLVPIMRPITVRIRYHV